MTGGRLMADRLLPTTVVGSYPQPDWLIDRDLLKTMVPRVRVPDLWRVPEAWLGQAQDDASLLAIRAMERAGIDIVTDGEIRRESYSNHFATALEGIDLEHPATITGRAGQPVKVPRIIGPIRRRHAVEVQAVKFLRANTDRRIKVTLPGPFTMARQASNEFYADEEELALDLAAAVNAEAKDAKQAGADIVQLDEPWLETAPEVAARFAVKAIDRALRDVPGPTAVHLCFGYAQLVKDKSRGRYAFLEPLADSTVDQISIEAAQPKLDLGVLRGIARQTIILGVLDLGDPAIETPEQVAARIREGLEHVPAERLIPAPDCGMKYLSGATAFGKLQALAQGAAIVRAELA
jgi:5-methyltetrahydropteroyltriglutamate--homocysteine methyltransferase